MHGTTIDRRSLLVLAFQKVWRQGRENPDYNAALGTTLFTRQSSASRQSLIAQYIKKPNLYILVIDNIPILCSEPTGFAPSERQKLDYYHWLAVSSLLMISRLSSDLIAPGCVQHQ